MLFHKRFILPFCTGIVIRVFFDPLVLQKTEMRPELISKILKREIHTSAVGSYRGLQNGSKSPITTPFSSHVTPNLSHGSRHAKKKLESQRLPNKVRVLCWIMTHPKNHKRKAVHIKNTWGRRCNKLIFMSSKSDEKLGAVGLPNVREGKDYWLWAKTKAAFKYVWEHHGDEADWFLKADDDAYVILENLRHMLSQYNPQTPIYFGAQFKLSPSVNDSYMGGGCGYVLSKEALRRFVQQALPDKNKCERYYSWFADVEMGRCLKAVGVEMGDSRDALGRYRFFHYPPESYVTPGSIQQTSWYWKRMHYPQSHGLDGCSDVAISFHYIKPNQMYLLEYLIYYLRVFGSTSPQ